MADTQGIPVGQIVQELLLPLLHHEGEQQNFMAEPSEINKHGEVAPFLSRQPTSYYVPHQPLQQLYDGSVSRPNGNAHGAEMSNHGKVTPFLSRQPAYYYAVSHQPFQQLYDGSVIPRPLQTRDDTDTKEEKRKNQNRRASAKARQKKRKHVADLEEKCLVIPDLEERCRVLEDAKDRLTKKVAELTKSAHSIGRFTGDSVYANDHCMWCGSLRGEPCMGSVEVPVLT